MSIPNKIPPQGTQTSETAKGGEGVNHRGIVEDLAALRRAEDYLRSEMSEVKKSFKAKMRILTSSRSAIFDDYDSDQLTLFPNDDRLSADARKVIDDPTL